MDLIIPYSPDALFLLQITVPKILKGKRFFLYFNGFLTGFLTRGEFLKNFYSNA
jgi:hypothetical protein